MRSHWAHPHYWVTWELPKKCFVAAEALLRVHITRGGSGAYARRAAHPEREPALLRTGESTPSTLLSAPACSAHRSHRPSTTDTINTERALERGDDARGGHNHRADHGRRRGRLLLVILGRVQAYVDGAVADALGALPASTSSSIGGQELIVIAFSDEG